MNPQKTAIIADTGCDIPLDFAKDAGIRMIPLHVIYPEGEYLDEFEIDPLTVYQRFPDEIPKTSMPSVTELEHVYEDLKTQGYENVIAIAISSQFSGTWNVMRLAAENMEGLNIYVFDTKNISAGAGVFAIWAARMLEKGLSFDEITAGLEKKIHDAHLMFYMDTLTYLEAGGRIGALSSLVGKFLHIKPIIACNEEGVYYTVAKCRGKKLAKVKLIKEMIDVSKEHDTLWLAIMNGNSVEEADDVAKKITHHLNNFEILYRKQIAATMAINTGPGLVGVLSFDPSL